MQIMRRKGWIVVPLLVVAALSVTACGSSSGGGSSKHPTIAWIQIGANNPFWTAEFPPSPRRSNSSPTRR